MKMIIYLWVGMFFAVILTELPGGMGPKSLGLGVASSQIFKSAQDNSPRPQTDRHHAHNV
jgi:hypothetical protein